MLNKKFLISCILILALVFSLGACKPKEDKGSSSSQEESVSESVESESSKSEESSSSESTSSKIDNESSDTEIPEGTAVGIIGNISFNYLADMEVQNLQGSNYYYYNDTSFFYAESVAVPPEAGEFDQEIADDFFLAAEQSFNEGAWINGKIVNGPEVDIVNGIEVWLCEIGMEREGVPFTNITAVTFTDDILTIISYNSDNESYTTFVSAFAETVMSMRRAEN